MTTTAVSTIAVEPKRIMRCTNCHSERVLRDAWAYWSFEQQEWILGETFDQAFCATCETDCAIESIPAEGA